MYMVMFVLNDPNQLDAVLDAWSEKGVTGVTIVETTGFFRRRSRPLGVRYWFSLPQAAHGTIEKGHYTLLAAVRDETVVDACLSAAEDVVGDLDQPNTGIFAAWPLSTAKGLRWQPPSDERNGA